MAAAGFIAGLILGGALVALLLRARLTGLDRDLVHSRGEVAKLTAEAVTGQAQATELQQQLAAARAELGNEVVALRTQLEQERQAAQDKIALLEDAEQRLTAQFKALSADALKSGREQLLEVAKAELRTVRTEAQGDLEKRQEAVAQMVAPIKESLGKVDARLEQIEKDRHAAGAQLSAEMRTVVEANERLRAETGALTLALRQPHTRGRWGELQLRRVIEMVGMTAYCDFVEQRSVDSADGRLRPDVIVNLPGGKQVVVDSKAPLQHFLDAANAPNEDARRAHLVAHARGLRQHMKALSAKSYWAQFDAAPDFVILFLPGEHFYSAALEIEPGLIEEGVKQCVLVATPMTLITLLRAVSYGWQQEKVAESARAVSELGRELHTRLALLVERIEKLGRRLDLAVGAYNDTVGTLEGRVLPSARRFEEHGAVSAGKELKTVAPLATVARQIHAPELKPTSDPPDREAA